MNILTLDWIELRGTTEHSLDRIFQSRSPIQSNPKKVEKNPGEETKYVKCDLCDKNASFKNYLRKCSMKKTK